MSFHVSRRFQSVCLVGAAALLGCGARPLPLTAQAGASVAIALAGELPAGDGVGYGGELLAARGRFDDQRGQLVFVLKEPVSGAQRELQTRIVTRALPDPASEIGLANQADPVAAFGIAQLLAIVDIPANVPPGTYDVIVRRLRRTDAGGTEELPALIYGQRLTVLPASVNGVSGSPTPSSAWAGSFSTDVSAQLANLVPHPKVVLTLPAPRPHAAHVVLTYPRTKVRPRTVIEEQHLGRGSIVAWTDDAASGRVTIDFVDPSASVKALALVFEPRSPLSAGRIALSEIGVASATFYDREGAVRTGTLIPTAIR